jgi:hypothetical protein
MTVNQLPGFREFEATIKSSGSTCAITQEFQQAVLLFQRAVLLNVSKQSVPRASELAIRWQVVQWTGAGGRTMFNPKNAPAGSSPGSGLDQSELQTLLTLLRDVTVASWAELLCVLFEDLSETSNSSNDLAVQRIRLIGEFLNDNGGYDEMVAVGEAFRNRRGHARRLETLWNRIGDWRG